MKKTLFLFFALGLVLGLGQLFLIRNITKQDVQAINTNNPACLALSPECGACMYDIKDGKCYEPAYTQKFRGFPFTSGSYGHDSRINVSPQILANIIIWALGLPLIAFASLKIRRNFYKT